MSLPHVTQNQIEAMNKISTEKMKKDNIHVEESAPEQTGVMHPTLATHPEPLYEEADQEVASDEAQESQDQELEVEDTAYAAPAAKESIKDGNFRVLRERAERAEREREELIRLLSAQNPKPQVQSAPVEEDPFAQLGIDDESLVEGKHLKELVREVKNLRSMVKGYEQKISKNDVQTMEMRLQAQYPDFNKVVTQDNLVRLRSMNPDLADSILANQDQYKQAKLAYEMVRQMGIYKDDVFESERVMAQKNSVKPRPLSSIAPTQNENPMSKVNAFANAPLTKDLKAKHWQEMQEAVKGM